jgi:hypothetical protein
VKLEGEKLVNMVKQVAHEELQIDDYLREKKSKAFE